MRFCVDTDSSINCLHLFDQQLEQMTWESFQAKWH